jgi:hypothetical protein
VSQSVELVDLGGVRPERRKWVHHFSDVTCYLHCVALGDYNLSTYEDCGVVCYWRSESTRLLLIFAR